MYKTPRKGRALAVIIASWLASAALAQPAQAAGTTILKSTLAFDDTAHTATLPLYEGYVAGKPVWYVITDASDASQAKKLSVVYSPGLASIGDGASQHVRKQGNRYEFEGAPDFSPQREYTPGAGGFPPKSAQPGSVGDSYSPFVRGDGIAGILNAPIVAVGTDSFDVVTHTNTEDRVVAIDTRAKTVTLVLARGFVDGRTIDYLSTEASDPVAASVERATYAPKLKKAAAAAAIPIGVIVDGPQSADAGQGLAYLALQTPLSQDATPQNAATIGSPFNILSLAPNADPFTASGYSPLWTVHVLPKGPSHRIMDFGTFASLRAKPAGFVVNCPVIAYE